jgi:hypothetical protein
MKTFVKTFGQLALGIGCLILGSGACAQHEEASGSYSVTPGTPLMRPIPHREYPTIIHQWIGDLERAGIVNRALPAPYRIALPLASFGDNGPTLMFTYARTLPGTSAAAGPLLFINIPVQ